MRGIHPSVMTHKLSIFKEAKLVAQKKQKFGDERRKVVQTKVTKLINAKFIIYNLVGKCHHGKEIKRLVENVCRLH